MTLGLAWEKAQGKKTAAQKPGGQEDSPQSKRCAGMIKTSYACITRIRFLPKGKGFKL